MKSTLPLAASLTALALVAPLACSPDAATPAGPPSVTADAGVPDDGPAVDERPPPLPFEAPSVASYVGKVKNLLVGQAATDAEVAAVAANPESLKTFIEQLMTTPEYTAKMLAFFGLAFQQTQIGTTDFVDQSRIKTLQVVAGAQAPMLLEALRESFARTALALVSEGRPFTEALTTRRFMMNVPLMMFHAYLDARDVDDTGKVTDVTRYPGGRVTFEAAGGPIPLADSLDPSNANYMVFHEPAVAQASPAACKADPIVVTGVGNINGGSSFAVLSYLLGGVVQYRGTGMQCNLRVTRSQLAGDAYDGWRMVTVRRAAQGETPTRFFDIGALAKANELVLRRPRVGFYTTPAFFAGWSTNASNQARVTINQALIVGLGRAIDGTDPTRVLSEAALESTHAPSTSACYGCHRTLDPMRQFFMQSYNPYFGPQTSPAPQALPPMFAVDGVSTAGASIADLGREMAAHPRFALAWAQKLCEYATSGPCLEDDPELVRIAQQFATSGFSWPVLVRELFASPLVTYATPSATVATLGEVFPISRRDHLCFSLSRRLGIPDACGLRASTRPPADLRPVQTIAASLPSDQYSRGATAPLFSNDPGLFFRTGLENVCLALAGRVVDGPGQAASLYQSSHPEDAMARMVSGLMGLTSDRNQAVLAVLREHFDAAKAAGATPAVALRSTFVLACLSPATVGIGQ